MSKPTKSGTPLGEYAIGYKRPPVETRFQTGRSGNPRGLPKERKSIGRLLEEALQRRVTVQENGRQRRMRVQDVILQGLVNDAARRNLPALKVLFALLDRYAEPRQRLGDASAMQAEDQDIIEAYLSSRLNETGLGTPETAGNEPTEAAEGQEASTAPEEKG